MKIISELFQHFLVWASIKRNEQMSIWFLTSQQVSQKWLKSKVISPLLCEFKSSMSSPKTFFKWKYILVGPPKKNFSLIRGGKHPSTSADIFSWGHLHWKWKCWLRCWGVARVWASWKFFWEFPTIYILI